MCEESGIVKSTGVAGLGCASFFEFLSGVECGDTIIIKSIPSICQSLSDLCFITLFAREKQVCLKSVDESWYDTSNGELADVMVKLSNIEFDI